MSSSDEAPEEVTFDAAKLSTRLNERKQKQARLEQQRMDKQKRRDRDARLKEQTSGRKKLLSEILQESESEEEPESEAAPIEKMLVQKKTFEDRDGFRIQIAEKPSRVGKKKWLPPAGSEAIKKRDAFLFRETVPRR